MKKISFLFALFAFAFSILAFFGVPEKMYNIDNGVLALVGICATLIVGANVIDVLKLQKIEEKMKELDLMKRELEMIKKENDELRINANIALNANWGFTLHTIQPKIAITQVWKAIKIAFSKNDTKRINTCLSILENLIKRIDKDKELSNMLKTESNGTSPIEIDDIIEGSEDYNTFKKRLGMVFQTVNNIIL